MDATLGGIDRDIVSDQQLLSQILFYNPEEPINIQEAQLAIIGVPEARNSYRNESCAM